MLTKPKRDGGLALPHSLYNFLVALAQAHPEPYAPADRDPIQADDRAQLIGLAVADPNKPGAYRLSRLGQALRHLFRDYAAKTVPDINLADVMLAMPDDIMNWLVSEAPLVENREGGRLFHALGGCVQMRGSHGQILAGRWLLTYEGRAALERAQRQIGDGTPVTHADPLSPEARGVLGRLMAGAQPVRTYDGRVVRGLDVRGVDLIEYPTPDTMRIRPECLPLAEALLKNAYGVELFLSFPEGDQLWFLNDLYTSGLPCGRELLFEKLNWVTIKHRGVKVYYAAQGKVVRQAVLTGQRNEDDTGIDLLDADDEFAILAPHSPSQVGEPDVGRTSEEDFEII